MSDVDHLFSLLDKHFSKTLEELSFTAPVKYYDTNVLDCLVHFERLKTIELRIHLIIPYHERNFLQEERLAWLATTNVGPVPKLCKVLPRCLQTFCLYMTGGSECIPAIFEDFEDMQRNRLPDLQQIELRYKEQMPVRDGSGRVYTISEYIDRITCDVARVSVERTPDTWKPLHYWDGNFLHLDQNPSEKGVDPWQSASAEEFSGWTTDHELVRSRCRA